jgi:hypothetical protein
MQSNSTAIVNSTLNSGEKTQFLYLHRYPKLYEGRYGEDVVLVIHDHRDISKDMLTYVKKWKLVTIRKAVQEYLKYKYDLDSLFYIIHFIPIQYLQRPHHVKELYQYPGSALKRILI